MLVEAHIDVVSAAAVVEGWARRSSQPGPVDVTLWLEGIFVGAATASAFRDDLLTAGIGHGHYAYRCKMNIHGLTGGLLELRGAGKDSDTVLAERTIEPGHFINLKQKQRRTVESLLVQPKSWSMDKVVSHLDVLDLESHLRQRGPKFYIAMAYQFLLNRWPDQVEYEFYLPDIRRNVLSATDIFHIIYNSEERQKNCAGPLSPFDPKFPFRARSEIGGGPIRVSDI